MKAELMFLWLMVFCLFFLAILTANFVGLGTTITAVIVVAGLALAIWALSKIADALMAAIDFMTRNEDAGIDYKTDCKARGVRWGSKNATD